MGANSSQGAARHRWADVWPKGDQRAIFSLTAIFWFAFQFIYFTYLSLRAEGDIVEPATFLLDFIRYASGPAEISIVLVGALLSIAIYIQLYALRQTPLWWQLIAAAILAIVSAVAFAIAISVLCELFDIPWPELTRRFLMLDTLRWIAPFGLWAGIALTVTYNSEMRLRERRLAMLQAREKEAQMRALRYQVNPHLLYNTLNSIAALILDGKNELAEAMVLRLSAFFRASLSSDPHADVPLSEEFALQRTYLEIEQMRFPRLRVTFDAPDDVLSAIVPGWILQPLIENVLKHGINPDGRSTHMAIRARRDEQTLIIEVVDNGPGNSASPGTGVGLSNVRSRLEARFGTAGRLERERAPLGGHVVRLYLPWRHP